MKEDMTLSGIRLRGHQALFAELGPVGFVRFMQQFVSRGDYTKDREKWISTIDLFDLENRVSHTPSRPQRAVHVPRR